MMMAARFRSVSKRFGDTVVLNDLDLEIPDRAVVAILGASGAGKSTLVRCLNFLEPINAGSIAVGDVSILPGRLTRDGRSLSRQEIAAFRSRIGMVFQGFHLFPHMTILQNLIEAPVGVLKSSRDEAVGKARTLLSRIGLADKETAYPITLSGGQSQRVAIARSLMMDPSIMLFDEPTSALDPVLTKEVQAVIRDLAIGGRTSLLVTHEIEFAKAIATHVLFMEGGRAHEFTPAETFFTRPRTLEARSFLGRIE